MEISELNQLPVNQKLMLIEQLWESILSQKQELASPNWHKEILEKRISDLESGNEKLLSLDEVKSQLKK